MDDFGMIGTRSNKLDAKGRVAVPAKWRDQLGDDIVVTIGAEGCLYVYRHDVFGEMMKKFDNSPFMSDDELRRAQRNFLFNSEELVLDKQGRILLTPEHRKYADINDEIEVTFYGAGNHLEIWKPEIWEKYNEGFDMAEGGKSFAALGL